MKLTINKASAEPAYEQICRQVEELVQQGLLAPGTRLPSIRRLATSLGLANSTVAIAYDTLAARLIAETRRGSGTYISGLPLDSLDVDLDRRKHQNVSRARQGMDWAPYAFTSEFFGMPQGTGAMPLIKLTQASPDPAMYPLERIKQVSSTMLWNPQSDYFDRANPQGHQPLVEYLEREMALQGVSMAEGHNDIILTGGFQRGLALLVQFLLRDGQKVAIESPCFTNIINLLITKRIGFVPIPVDAAGMDTEYLAGVLARGEVQAVITMPTFHNPTGVCMSRERREHLLDLAEQYRVPIIEDDWGRALRYEGEDDLPLKAMDSGGYVLHIGTFSKTLLPGLRIGWITCPADVAVQLVRAKAGTDNSDSQFLQALLANFIGGGHYHRHLRHTLKHYRKRRDAMLTALDTWLPPGCRYSKPQGGFSVWLELPAHIRSMPLLRLARQNGVDFLPAAFMMPDRHDTSALRLSFSRTSEQDIEAGVKQLCVAISDSINNPDLLKTGYRRYEDLYQ